MTRTGLTFVKSIVRYERKFSSKFYFITTTLKLQISEIMYPTFVVKVSYRGGGESRVNFGSILLQKRFWRFLKNGQFKNMCNTVRKTVRIPKIT